MKNKKTVVIVGAGIAGLTCARQLMKHSDTIDVILLEASDRIGGRIRSHVADDGTILELGAHFIHGTIGNPIYDFAVEQGIIKEDNAGTLDWQPFTISHHFHKSVKASDEEKKKAVDIVCQYTDKLIDDMGDSHDIPPDISVGEFFNRNFNNFKIQFQDKSEGMQQALQVVFNFFLLGEASHNGCYSLNDLDLLAHNNYEYIPGNTNYTPEAGYHEIVDAVYASVAEGCLRKNHKVCNFIKQENDENIAVLCENGMTFLCDTVVLTVSCEVLKTMIHTEGFFVPPLPAEKSMALTHMKLSRVLKMYFRFVEPLADKDVSYFRFYPPTSTDEFVGGSNFADLDTFDRIKTSDWWLIWANGRLIDEFESSENKVDFFERCLKAIKMNYPGFPQSLQIDPDSIVVSGWNDDPLYLGGYSYFECGAEGEKDIEALRNPIILDDKCSLLFSGEMTDSRFYSTTHAGFESGGREADRIEKMFNL